MSCEFWGLVRPPTGAALEGLRAGLVKCGHVQGRRSGDGSLGLLRGSVPTSGGNCVQRACAGGCGDNSSHRGHTWAQNVAITTTPSCHVFLGCLRAF